MIRSAALGLGLCGLVSGVYFASGVSSPPATPAPALHEGREDSSSTRSQDRGQDEIQELKAQLRDKENTVRTLSVATRAALESARMVDPSASQDDTDFARVLRSRMAESLSRVDGADEARLFEFASSLHGRALDAKVVCGGSMCEVSLARGEERTVEEGLKALANTGSKGLPVQVVLEEEERVALFFAIDEDSLRREELTVERPEPTIVQWPSDPGQTRDADGADGPSDSGSPT